MPIPRKKMLLLILQSSGVQVSAATPIRTLLGMALKSPNANAPASRIQPVSIHNDQVFKGGILKAPMTIADFCYFDY